MSKAITTERRESRVTFANTKNDNETWDYLNEMRDYDIRPISFIKRCVWYCIQEIKKGNLKYPF